jgi:hypothetical protein
VSRQVDVQGIPIAPAIRYLADARSFGALLVERFGSENKRRLVRGFRTGSEVRDAEACIFEERSWREKEKKERVK